MVSLLYSLLAVFAVSFVSNATPFFGVSYTLVATSFLTQVGVTPLNFSLFVLVSSLGSSSSKNVMYLLGLGLGKPLSKGSKNVELLKKFVKSNSFYLVSLVASVIPFLPLDDYLYLGNGIVKGPLLKLNAVVTLGKLIKSSIEIPVELAGLTFLGSVTSFLGLSEFELGLLGSALFIALGIVAAKLDWQKYYAKVERFLPRRLKPH